MFTCKYSAWDLEKQKYQFKNITKRKNYGVLG